jgi:gliding motility-associated-like protein
LAIERQIETTVSETTLLLTTLLLRKMIRKIVLVTACWSLSVASAVVAQNLVVNPSFELTTSNCSSPFGEGYSELIDWDDTNSGNDTCTTPDLFSACNLLIGGMGPTHMPNSQLGYQYSHTGTRHAGFISHELGSQYREYVQGRISTPLTAGQTYCVSFYVSLANNSLFATNNMGIRFTNANYQHNACPGSSNSLINLAPQLNSTCTISDTAGWIRLQWDYVAAGGEQYFVIGNFFNNAGTNIVNHPVAGGGMTLPMPFAYYFVDDVSITPATCCAADIVPVPNVCVSDAPFTLAAVPPLGASCAPLGVIGTWSGPGITNATTGLFDPSVAGPGTHAITFQLACGTIVTTSVIVSPCTAMTICLESNGDLTASNGVAPYQWQSQVATQDCSACLFGCVFPPGCATTSMVWTTYASTATATPGTLPIQVVDNAGTVTSVTTLAGIPACSVTPPCPSVTISATSQTNVSCNGGANGALTVNATGGNGGPFTYAWNPGALSGASQTALSATTYTITATGTGGCQGTNTFTITQPATLSATTSSTAATCGANNGSATVTPSGGIGPYTYSWAPSGGTAATTTPVGPGSYTATVTDNNGCTTTAAATVGATGGPALTISNQQNLSCFGAGDGQATVSASGGTAPYTYAWSPSGETTATASQLIAGSNTVTVTDAGGCQANSTITLTQPSALSATTSSTDAACSATNGSATVTPSGGTGPYSYSWAPSGGTAATTTPVGSGVYTATVTDNNGCTTTAAATVGTIGGPALTISGQQNNSCFGINDGQATVSATGGTAPYTYAWSPSGETTAAADQLVAGSNTVTVTDAGGCAVSQQVTLTGPSQIALSATVTDEDCGEMNGSVTTMVSGGTTPYTYAWTGSASTTGTASNLGDGTYNVTVTDANGCTVSNIFIVDQTGSLTVGLTPASVVINEGTSVQLTASGGTTYQWGPVTGLSCTTCPNPIATPTVSTIYQVTVTDGSGCSGTASMTITVNAVCGEVFVPTIFSPNADNGNDFLCAFGNCFTEVEFAIYNRWGEKVFETDDLEICWDGTYKGKEVNAETFVYKLTGSRLNGEEVNLSGNVTVIR